MLYREVENKLKTHDTQLEQINHKGFVTYEQFGAKLDGITDDTLAIKSCHKYANENNVKVIQNRGKTIISDTIEVKTDVDLRGLTVIVNITEGNDASNRGRTIYKIIGKSLEVLSKDNLGTSLAKGSVNLNILNRKGAIFFNSSEFFMRRNNAEDIYNVNKGEVNYIINGLLIYPLLFDYTTSMLNVEFREDDNPLIFNAPNFEVNEKTKIKSLIRIERNNVTVTSLNESESNTYEDISPVYCIVEVNKCYNTYFEDMNVERCGRNSSVSNNKLGYYILYYMSACSTIDNIRQGLNSWSGPDGNYFRDIKIKNSKLTRISSHGFLYDLYVERCILKDNVMLMGGGVADIDKCIFLPSKRGCIETREDYASYFDGSITIRDCVCNKKTDIVKFMMKDYDFGITTQLPNVYIENCDFNNDGDSVSSLVNFMSYTQPTKAIGYPKKITIKNVNVNTNTTHTTVKFNYPIQSDVLNGVMNIYIDDLKINKEAYCIPKEKVYQDASCNIAIPIIENSNFYINYDLKNSIANMRFFSATPNVKIKLFNCETLMTLNAGTITDSGTLLEFNNCIIYRPYNSGAGMNKYKSIIKNSIFKCYIDEDGVKDEAIAYVFCDTIIYASNNISEISSKIFGSDKIYNYIDTSYFKNS